MDRAGPGASWAGTSNRERGIGTSIVAFKSQFRTPFPIPLFQCGRQQESLTLPGGEDLANRSTLLDFPKIRWSLRCPESI
jgi:hypothetical protein